MAVPHHARRVSFFGFIFSLFGCPIFICQHADCCFAIRCRARFTASGSTTVPVTVWLPPTAGGWVEWNSSRLIPAGAPAVTVNAGLADLPIFVKSGAVLPLLCNDFDI